MKMDITDRIDAVTKIGEDRIRMGGIQPPPKSGKIELSPRCNLRCKFCAVRTRDVQPIHDMDFDLFKRITEDMRIAGVEEIGVFYLGESFMNPNLLTDAVRWLKKSLQFPYVFLTSNATLAVPSIVGRLMESGLDSLKWSVNSMDAKQYKEITGCGHLMFDLALDNIKAAYECRKAGGYHTMLSASSILYEGEQLDRMNALLDERVRPYVDRHYWLPLYQMGMYRAKVKAETGFMPTAGNMGRIDDETLEPNRQSLPCWSAFTEGHVRADGGLSACCFGSDARFDMGNLNEERFMEAWNNRKFAKLREAHIRTLTEGQDALKGTVCEVCVGWEE